MVAHAVESRTVQNHSVTMYQLASIVACDRCNKDITVVYFVVPHKFAAPLECVCHQCFEDEYVFLTLEGSR